jgi:protein TonB
MRVEREDQRVRVHEREGIVLECSKTFMTILTMLSLSRPSEKAYESGGVPWRAFGWSLGLHALALGAWSGVLPPASAGIAPAEPLKASLRTLPEAVVVAAVPEPPPARPPWPRPASRPLVAPADAVLPAPTFSEPVSLVQAEAMPAGGVPVQHARTEAVSVALATPQAQGGPDAAGLRQYRLALAGAAKRFRTYPEAARRDGLAGTAEIRVEVLASAARHAELARSSGHEALDSAALEMLRAAAARTTLPESLRGQAFAVLLPVIFEVEQ